MTRAKNRQTELPRARTTQANDVTQSGGASVFWLSAALLCLAFIFGGASRENPVSTMAIELLGILLLTATVWSGALTGPGRPSWPATALLGGILMIPLLQLVSLPPDIWTTLPGRREAVETLRIAQIEPGWAPLSLDPEATFRAFLWLIPSSALFLAVAGLNTMQRFWLAGVVLALCIASLVLGGLQITDKDGGLFQLRESTHSLLPIGFFANRNHQGIAMVAALPFAAAFAANWRLTSKQRARVATIVFAALVALLVVGVLVTRSRAGLTLAVPALAASIALFWAASGKQPRREAILMIGAVVVAVGVAAQFTISAVFDRFETLADGDGRFDMWPSIIKGSADVAPVGAGLSTFGPFYRAWEPLDLMGSNFINHAHNDYLELWLEAGWLAPLVLGAIFLWLGRAALRAWSGPGTPTTNLARAGSVAIIVLMIHSVVDYPLRTEALASVFAFAAACLTPSRHSPLNSTGWGLTSCAPSQIHGSRAQVR